MSSGSFSWFPLLKPWKFKTTKKSKKLAENEPTIVSATKEYTSVEDRVMEINTKMKSSENYREVIPTTTKYMTATWQQALMSKSAAVSLIQEAFGVALEVIELYNDTSAIEQEGKELLCDLMDITNSSDKVIAKAAKGIERDIKDVLSILMTINDELEIIIAQYPWLLGIYNDLNASPVEDCLDRLSSILEKFKFSNELRKFDFLQELHTRVAKIKNLIHQSANKVGDVHKEMKNLMHMVDTRLLATLRSSGTAVQQMPLKPGVFHGRDIIIEEITQLFMKEETSRVCILGPCGMGKTSVSLGVVEQPLIKARFLPENVVWVPCIKATSATLLLEILSIQLRLHGSKQVTMEEIISFLDTSTQPRLILLDNFETPYNVLDGSQKQVEDILHRLAMLSHVAILVTMRGIYPPCDEAIKWQSKDIGPTDEAACLRIYHGIHPDSKNDRDVAKLLSVLGHMPFAVTLMAKLAKRGQSTAEELLLAWSEHGPDIFPNRHEESINRSISLSVDSYLMKQNPQALLLLKILSCLPAGTPKATLRWWVPACHLATVPSAIAILSAAGLLVKIERQGFDSPVLFIIPVVQSFMQQRGRIEEEIRHNIHLSCCQYVLDHACCYDDPAFPFKSKALAAEDTNIQAILHGSGAMQHSIRLSDIELSRLSGSQD